MKRALLLALVAMLTFPSAAFALPDPGGGSNIPQPQPTQPSTTGTTAPPAATGVLGTSDVLAGLGAVDANCKNATGVVAVNCKSTGFAATAYPPSNTAPDVNVNRGLDSPEGWVMGPLQDILSALFTVFVYIVTGIVMILSAAMSFDIFRSNQAQIAHVLNSATGSFTWPMMVLAVTILGGFAAWYVFQRQMGKAVAYTLGALGAIVITMAILSSPATTLGPVDDLANGITAILPGALSGNAPNTGGFAQAEPALWKAAIEEPWCALEFGDPTWCMQPPDAAMRQARSDIAANHMADVLGSQDVNGVMAKNPQVQSQEMYRMNAARTNGELFLSFITNANVRNGKNDSWTFYNVVAKEHPELTGIRGPGGWGTRISILLFGTLAGIFFLGTMIYIAYQVAMNAVWIVIMIFLMPVAVLACVFGDAGMRVFKKAWGHLLGAFLIKLLYAAYLGVLLAVSGFVLLLNHGWFLDWMVLALVWAMAWFKRKAILDMLSHGHHAYHDHIAIAAATGGLVGRRVAGYAFQRSATKGGVEDAIHDEKPKAESNTTGDNYYNLHYHAPNGTQNGNGHHPDRMPDIEGHLAELEEGN